MAKALQGIVGAVLVIYGTYTGNPGLVKFGYSLIVSNILTVAAQALVGKPRLRKTINTVEYAGTVEPRRIVYGAMRLSGMNVIGAWTSGQNRENLHQILAIAGHPIHSFGSVYYGDTAISNASIGAVTGTTTDGAVSSGKYSGKTWIRRYDGTQTDADAIMQAEFGGVWDSTHVGNEIAYAAMMFLYDEEVYQSGKPQPIMFDVEGKEVYDPRLDTSPGANPTSASYIAYSQNAALCAADYFTDDTVGLGIPAAKIDWDSVVAAANICDESVTVPDDGSPALTSQPRYTCNVALYAAITDDEARANIETLASAMLGHISFRGGKYQFYAGAAATPSFTLTEDDLVGKVSIRTEMPSNEKYNFVRGQFVDPDRGWELAEFPPQDDSAYEATDGDRLPRETLFIATTNSYEAQRKARVVLRRSRLKRQVTVELGMSAFGIRPWDVGTMTLEAFGWTAQQVRCMSWTMRPDGVIEATFLEDDSDVWDDPVLGDYTLPDGGTPPDAQYFTPEPPTAFSAIGTQDGIIFQWTPTDGMPTGTTYRIYEDAASEPSPEGGTLLASNLYGRTVTIPRTTTDTAYFWIRSYFGGETSDLFPIGAGISAAATAISSGFRLNATTQSITTKLFDTGSGSSATVTVTPVEAAGSVTYAWTRVSGSTAINATSASTAATAFSVTGMVDSDIFSAVFRCTATDDGTSPLGTATIDVTVTFRCIYTV